MKKRMLLIATAAVASSVQMAWSALVPIAAGGTVTVFTPTISTFTGTYVTGTTASFSNAFENGTVTESVYKNADGTLNFYYKLTNSNTSADYLTRLTVGDFAGFSASVDYLTAGGTAPSSATFQNAADSVGFYVKTLPGTSSAWLEVSTNATNYNSTGTISLIDSLSVNLPGVIGPATPEPLSTGLLGLGLLGVGVFRWRSSRKPV